MKNLIIGMGEIGTAVLGAVCPDARTYDKNKKNNKVVGVDVMHICFPYSDTFVKDVMGYMTKFEPKHVVIWSTVPIGTTKKIAFAIHSPVEGRHPDLELSIRQAVRWLGCNYVHEAQFFFDYFTEAGLKPKIVNDSNYTEALKLLSTAEYGINIAFADYKKRVADEISMDFQLTKDWNLDYNKLYYQLGDDRFRKFVLDPPGGHIGGHCIIPNAELLSEDYPDDLLDIIEEYK